MSEINEYIYWLRSDGPLKNDRKWNAKAQGMVLERFGIDLSRQAIRGRYRRVRDSKADTEPPSEGGKMEVYGNEAYAQATIGVDKERVDTLKEALDRCKVDLDVWAIDRHMVNYWEVAAKSRDINLKYIEGKATGTVRKGGLGTKTVCQVKIWFKRKTPLALNWEPIKPVEIGIDLEAARGAFPAPESSDILTCLVVPDSQNGYKRDIKTGWLEPFHDRAAWDIIIQVAKESRPNLIILCGDMLDFAELTDRFPQEVEFMLTMQPAIKELAWWLGQLRTVCPYAEIKYIEGNHEARLPRWVQKNTRWAYEVRPADDPNGPPLLSVERLLGLKGLEIEYLGNYPNSGVWVNNNLQAVHGETTRKGAGDAVKAVLADAGHSVIMGHGHKLEMASKTTKKYGGDRTFVAIEPGCICRTGRDSPVPGRRNTQSWQQGLLKVHYEPGNGIFGQELAAIYNGRAVVSGRKYEARREMVEAAALVVE